MPDEFDYGPAAPSFTLDDFPAYEDAPTFSEEDLRVLYSVLGDLKTSQQEWTLKQNQSLANFAIGRLEALLNKKDPK